MNSEKVEKVIFDHDFRKTPQIPELALRQIKAIRAAKYGDSAGMSSKEFSALKNREATEAMGGSVASTIMNQNQFQTIWDLWLKCTGMATTQEEESNWFRLEYGHRVEPLAAELFARKFNAAFINETGMYKHPEFPFVRGNIDGLAILGGELVATEFKSSYAFAKEVWEKGVPVYYKWQGRHYLNVLNAILANAGLPPINRVYFGCLYGNTEDDYIVRSIDATQKTEQEAMQKLLTKEVEFWTEYVVPKKIPMFVGDADKFVDIAMKNRVSLAQYNRYLYGENMDGQTESDSVTKFGMTAQKNLYEVYMAKKEAMDALKKQVEAIETELDIIKGEMILLLDGNDKGEFPNGATVNITTRPSRSVNYDLMKEVFPEAYRECVEEKRTKPILGVKKPPKKKKVEKEVS